MHPPVVFGQACNGCNLCVEICPMDIFVASPEVHGAPIVMYPEECRYCGACWQRCPHRAKDALRIIVPPAMRISILRGATLQ